MYHSLHGKVRITGVFLHCKFKTALTFPSVLTEWQYLRGMVIPSKQVLRVTHLGRRNRNKHIISHSYVCSRLPYIETPLQMGGNPIHSVCFRLSYLFITRYLFYYAFFSTHVTGNRQLLYALVYYTSCTVPHT